MIGYGTDIDYLNPNISERIISDLFQISTAGMSTKYYEMIDDIKKVVDILSRQGLALNIGELLTIFKCDKENANIRLSGAIFHLKMAGLIVDNKGIMCKAFFNRQKPLIN